MHEEAIAEHQKANRPWTVRLRRPVLPGLALAWAGRRREAHAILDKLKTTKEYVSPAELAALYAMLGENEGAIVRCVDLPES